MYASSTQKRHWTFDSEETLEKLRRKSNGQFIAKFRGTKDDQEIQSYFLTYEEERLIVEHYEIELKEFCVNFAPPMPNNVIGTMFHYFKRFYLNNSVMEYHPKEISISCAYLACKIEEFNLTIDQFTSNIKGDDVDKKKVTEIVLNNELLIMESIQFHLTIFSSYTPAEGFLEHIRVKDEELQLNIDTEAIKPQVDAFLNVALFTDVYLIFTPQQIALAAIVEAASQTNKNLDNYVTEALIPDKKDLAKVANAINRIRGLIIAKMDLEDEGSISLHDLEQKLSACRNQEHNPYSQVYKSKMQEDLEDDDDDEMDMW